MPHLFSSSRLAIPQIPLSCGHRSSQPCASNDISCVGVSCLSPSETTLYMYLFVFTFFFLFTLFGKKTLPECMKLIRLTLCSRFDATKKKKWSCAHSTNAAVDLAMFIRRKKKRHGASARQFAMPRTPQHGMLTSQSTDETSQRPSPKLPART